MPAVHRAAAASWLTNDSEPLKTGSGRRVQETYRQQPRWHPVLGGAGLGTGGRLEQGRHIRASQLLLAQLIDRRRRQWLALGFHVGNVQERRLPNLLNIGNQALAELGHHALNPTGGPEN